MFSKELSEGRNKLMGNSYRGIRMSEGSEGAWQVTFRNFKYFRLFCVFGKARKVCGKLVGRISRAGEIIKQGTSHKGILYHIVKFGLYFSWTLRRV